MEGRMKRIFVGFVFYVFFLFIGRFYILGIENRILKWFVLIRGIVVDKEKYILVLGVFKWVNLIE